MRVRGDPSRSPPPGVDANDEAAGEKSILYEESLFAFGLWDEDPTMVFKSRSRLYYREQFGFVNESITM